MMNQETAAASCWPNMLAYQNIGADAPIINIIEQKQTSEDLARSAFLPNVSTLSNNTLSV